MDSRKYAKGVSIEFIRHPLEFKKPAQTSRDTLTFKPSFFLTIRNNEGRTGVGECSLIPGLSLESESEAEEYLERLTRTDSIDLDAVPKTLPAVRFAVETALIDFYRDGSEKWKGGIPINGLVWMGSQESMLKQVDELVDKGFKTIKLKVGTLPFHEELEMLEAIRSKCPKGEFTIRIDANGAFGKDVGDGLSALDKLKALEHLCLHSIEQPIPAGRLSQMKELCENSPIPIALDEELIGVHQRKERIDLLKKLKPAYIVLKPSLIGGLESAKEFVDIANDLGIGWWATSALESNVGLAAISEWTTTVISQDMAQGLGTGSLFTNNTDSTLFISEGKLYSHSDHSKPSFLYCAGQSFELSEEGARKFKDNLQRPLWTEGVAEVLEVWFNNSTTSLIFTTSGSSGSAREITHSREALISSAKATLEFFDLGEGDRLAMAMPIDFVAGRMMLIRAIVGGCDIEIAEPKARPVFEKPIDFLSLTPHQCTSLLPSFPQVKKLLLGGGAVSEKLKRQLPVEVEVWEGFGMTETITHIALRKISQEATTAIHTPFSNFPFTALPGVSFKTSETRQLIINAPTRNVTGLVTDDVVELLSSTSFRWIGRVSQIINSGGIKVNPEFVEREIRGIMEPLNCEYIVLGRPNDLLGEIVVLKIEHEGLPKSVETKILDEISSLNHLPPHNAPRMIEYGPIEKSERGKTKRD